MENTSNKKNIWIGIGVVVVVIAIILVLALTGKKGKDMAPADTTADTTTETSSSSTKGTASAPARSTFSVISPKSGSTLTRGMTYTISWTGDANCYDLGYSLNPKQDTPYNFIGKVCENNKGVFSHQWLVPGNLTPGTYGLELKNSGTTGDGTNSVTYYIK